MGVSKCVGEIGMDVVVVLGWEVDPWTSRRATGDIGDTPCERNYNAHDICGGESGSDSVLPFPPFSSTATCFISPRPSSPSDETPTSELTTTDGSVTKSANETRVNAIVSARVFGL